MKASTELTEWAYHGLWGILSDWFKVPRGPPGLPVASDQALEQFKPAPEFLAYLRFLFLVGNVPAALVVLVGCLGISLVQPWLGLLLGPIGLLLAFWNIVPGLLAVYLRYDTTWYVITGSSMRIRRGIWILHETTITFENIQNVSVHQGPLQRWFGIADVVVDTAGGGRPAMEDQGGVSHRGLIEGVTNAHQIRDLLLQRLKLSKTAGLGDEEEAAATGGFGPAHIAALREIRDALRIAVERKAAR